MAQKRDYYEVLGLDKGAGADDIKRAYRKLAKQYHPDVNKAPDAEEKFKELSEAYEVLIEPNKKANYDQYGHQGVSFGSGDFKWQDFSHFSDIEDMFGGSDFFGRNIFDIFLRNQDGGFRGQSGGAARGADLRYDIELSLEDIAEGITRKVSVTRYEKCDGCRGTGSKSGSLKACPECKGRGQVMRQQRTPFGLFQSVSACGNCNGRGRVADDPCNKCAGVSIERKSRDIDIKVPAGIAEGNHLRLKGEGNAGSYGGPAGDLFVVVHEKDHPTFERHGSDLLCEVQITFTQAALGAEVEVPGLKGHTKLKIPAGTQTHTVFRLRGQGLPRLSGSGKGDEHIRVVVAIPKGLNKKQRQLIEELAKVEDQPGGNIWDRIKDTIG